MYITKEAGDILSFDNNLTELFTMFLTVGGLGFVNYFILSRLDKINVNKHNKEDKPLFLIFFSLMNYVFYLIILYMVDSYLPINNEYLILATSIALTLIVTVLTTFIVYSPLSSKMQKAVNKARGNSGMSSYDSLTVKKRVFNFSGSRMIFIYDLNNNLIDCGHSGWLSELEDDDFELSLYPFTEKSTILEYDDVIDYINKNGKASEVYINIDKNVKIIVIY